MAFRNAGMVALMGLLVAGCGLFGDKPPRDPSTYTTDNPYGTDPKYADPRDYNPRTQGGQNESNLSLMSALFGNSQPTQGEAGGGAIGVSVNSFLWRASLDTVSFMPLAAADPFGGVIVTDWYSPPDTPNERFKVNIFILNRELRADGVRASVFHQRRDGGGQWIEAAVDANTGTDLENAILTRARQLRLSTAQK